MEEEEEERVPPWRRAVPRTPRQATASSGRARARFHPMVFIRAGLLLALLLWIGVTQVLAWGNGVLDLLQYGIHISSDDRLDQFSPRKEVVRR